MKAIIEIDMDNAAFEGQEGFELGRILKNLGGAIQLDWDGKTIDEGIRDINGNTVGTFRVEGDE